MRLNIRNHIIFVSLSLFSLAGCQKEKVPKAFYPRSAHEAYAHSLEQAKLHLTALGAEWIHAGQTALEEAVDISLPFQESFYWDARKAEASGYRFLVKRGVRIEVELSIYATDSLLLFADLFRERGDSLIQRIHVATADEDTHRLEFEPRRDAYYALRLQPELLRGGKFSLLIREVPSIGFPVKGKNSRSIASFFGDPRDGGTRDHHGVDIFAPRHTSVLAPSNSSVTRVGEGDIGGKYIWLYDSQRSMYLYFAHLETRDVEAGDLVRAGQVIGTVGNSGNARTTAPHLHFGIYRNGPIDPFSFIAETDTIPEGISGDELILGRMAQTKEIIIARNSPSPASIHLDTLEVNSRLIVKGLTGKNMRVELPDGSYAYIQGEGVDLMN
jgi:murein DD-endopeptidase MepM/ murein hydrolase activator NlpD